MHSIATTPIWSVKKSEVIPLQAWTGPLGSSKLRFPELLDNRHMKVARLSALNTGRLYTPRRYQWYSFLLETGPTPEAMTLSVIEPATFRICSVISIAQRRNVAVNIGYARQQEGSGKFHY